MAKFNLSLDDFSPHPRAGLNFESIEWCDRLINLYPDIKINLFVPAAYCRLGEKPSYLTENLEWVERANQLPHNYRINCHGFFHRRMSVKRGNSNNDEWQFLNGEEAKTLVVRMEDEFKLSDLKYHKTFRPPGWKISAPAADTLTKMGFLIAGNKEYFNKVQDKVKNLKWIAYNWDMVKDCSINGDVIAYGHTSDWTNNYMNKDRFDMAVNLLQSRKFDFRFLEEL